MPTWQRCPKSPFYRRASFIKRFDKKIDQLDKTYVDPIDLIVIHTIPADNRVTVMKWRVAQLDSPEAFDLLEMSEMKILLAWAERVSAEMEGGISRERKAALLGDLDVDQEARALLLSAVERFVFMSPPESSEFTEQELPLSREAVDGLLFHFGIGPC